MLPNNTFRSLAINFPICRITILLLFIVTVFSVQPIRASHESITFTSLGTFAPGTGCGSDERILHTSVNLHAGTYYAEITVQASGNIYTDRYFSFPTLGGTGGFVWHIDDSNDRGLQTASFPLPSDTPITATVVLETNFQQPIWQLTVTYVCNTGEVLLVQSEPAEPPSPAKKVIVFLEGVCSSTEDNTSTGSAAFNELQRLLRQEYGYRNSDFLRYSYTGGFMENLGGVWTWHHSAYERHTPISQSLETSLGALHDQLLIRYHDKYPNATFVLVGHSLGGVIAMEEVVHKVGIGSYPRNLISKVITIDSPLQGVPETINIQFINEFPGIRPYWTCVTRGLAFNQLVNRYNQGYLDVLVNAVHRANQFGIEITTIGNNYDCTLAPQLCSFPFTFGDINVQYIPHSAQIGFELAEPCLGFEIRCLRGTHSAVLNNQNGLRTIAEHIGIQG